MTTAVRNLIESFDALPDSDKHDAAITILQRYAGALEGTVSEAALVEAADSLFQTLDFDEASNAPR